MLSILIIQHYRYVDFLHIMLYYNRYEQKQ